MKELRIKLIDIDLPNHYWMGLEGFDESIYDLCGALDGELNIEIEDLIDTKWNYKEQ